MKGLIVLLLLFVAGFDDAKGQKLDSLRQIWKTSSSDSLRLRSLADLIWYTIPNDVHHALRLCDTLKILANLSEADSYENRVRYYRGVIYRFIGNYPVAVEYLDSARLFWENKGNRTNVAHALYQLGAVHQARGDMTSAIDCLNENIIIYTQLHDLQSVATSVNAKGTVFRVLQEFAKAEEAFLEAQKIFQQLDNSPGIAMVYNNLGNLKVEEGDYLQGRRYFENCREICLAISDEKALGYAYEGLGICHFRLGNLPLAIKNLQKSIRIQEEMQNNHPLANSYLVLAQVFEAQYETAEAEALVRKALSIATRFGIREVQKDASLSLSQILEKQGKPAKALQHLHNHRIIADSLHGEKVSRQVAEMEARYQVENRQSQLERMSIEHEMDRLRLDHQRWAVIALSLALLLVAFFLHRFMRMHRKVQSQKQIAEKALSERELLLGEIHHRVKNNLQIISSLLSLQSRTLQDGNAVAALIDGRSRVESMALIHQDLYEEENLTGIEVEGYIEKLCKNLYATYNVRGDRISLCLDVDPLLLDVNTLIPLGLILNELIANALKYAFPNERKGQLKVSFKQMDNYLSLEVRDNGIGLKGDGESGFGHRLIRAFAKKLDADIEVTEDQGMVVALKVRNYKVA